MRHAMVTFCITWTTTCHISDQMLFLSVSVSMFLEEVSFRIGGLSRAEGPSPVWVGTIPSIKGLKRTRRWRKVASLPVSLTAEGRHLPSPALSAPGSPAFRLQNLPIGFPAIPAGLPGSPTCRHQIMRCLSLPNCVSQ